MKKIGILSSIALLLFMTTSQANASVTNTQGEAYEQGKYQTEAPAPYGQNYSLNSPVNSTDTNKINWHFDLRYDETNNRGNKAMHGAPTIDKNGIVYMNSVEGFLYAFNRDGSIKWKTENMNGLDNSGSSLLSEDGTLYNVSKNIYAINTSDGSIKWKTPTSSTSVFKQAVIDKDGTLFSLNNYTSDAVLYAFNPDGTVKYKGTSNISKYGYQPVGKKMVMGKNGLIYAFVGTAPSFYILAFNKQGELVWNHLIKYDGAGYDLDTSGNIIITANVLNSRQVIYKVNGETGQVMTEPKTIVDRSSSRIGSPVVDQKTGNIYVNINSSLYKLDPDFNVIWNKQFGLQQEVVIDKSGNLVFAAQQGIFKIDPDGNELWTVKAADLSYSGALGLTTSNASIDEEGKVYVSYGSARKDETYLRYDFISIGDPVMQWDNTCVNYEAMNKKMEDGTMTATEQKQEIDHLESQLTKLKEYTPSN